MCTKCLKLTKFSVNFGSVSAYAVTSSWETNCNALSFLHFVEVPELWQIPKGSGKVVSFPNATSH